MRKINSAVREVYMGCDCEVMCWRMSMRGGADVWMRLGFGNVEILLVDLYVDWVDFGGVY